MASNKHWAQLSERLEDSAKFLDPETSRLLRKLGLSPRSTRTQCEKRLQQKAQKLPGLGEILPKLRLGAKHTDFFFDLYCPKTYLSHFRMSYWVPRQRNTRLLPKLEPLSRKLLEKLRLKRSRDYVLGLNSRIGQYSDAQILMLDLDRFDESARKELRKIGGYLFKSGRGYHFVAKRIYPSTSLWKKALQRTYSNPRLGKCLDQAHKTLSLQRGYSTLRITSSPSKRIKPFFVEQL